MFVTCGIWCLVDVSIVSPSSEQTKSAKHHIPQVTNIPYQPLLYLYSALQPALSYLSMGIKTVGSCGIYTAEVRFYIALSIVSFESKILSLLVHDVQL